MALLLPCCRLLDHIVADVQIKLWVLYVYIYYIPFNQKQDFFWSINTYSDQALSKEHDLIWTWKGVPASALKWYSMDSQNVMLNSNNQKFVFNAYRSKSLIFPMISLTRYLMGKTDEWFSNFLKIFPSFHTCKNLKW